MMFAHEKAKAELRKCENQRKEAHDKDKNINSDLSVGQKVYLRNRGIRGRDKIQDKYKQDIFVIADRPFHAVYTVKPFDSDGPLKNVNRSEIKAIHCDKRDGSPESDESEEPEVPLALRRTKRSNAGYHRNYFNQPRSVKK